MWIRNDSAPTAAAYGTKDKIQPYLASLRLKGAREENPVDFSFFELLHSGRGLQNDNKIFAEYIKAAEKYLAKYMG